MSRMVVLLYGIVSYFVGLVGMLSIVAVLAGLMPYGFLISEPQVSISPLVWNIVLVFVWGAIHTGMARPGFKTTITKIIPEPAERSTYVLVAGVTSVVLVGCWHSLPGQLWHFEPTILAYTLWGIFVFGWVFLVSATFAINHFDLFGLRQVYLHFRNQERAPLSFVKRAMYKYIRHPIQTGALIGVWATPSMTMTQLVLSLGFTVYIFVGLWFEERDLIRLHGDEYQRYRMEAGMVFPKIR